MVVVVIDMVTCMVIGNYLLLLLIISGDEF